MSSVCYFRFTKTVSLKVKLFGNGSLETSTFIARPCLFIPLQEKSTVTAIRLIVKICDLTRENVHQCVNVKRTKLMPN